jgi:hypothetical protein
VDDGVCFIDHQHGTLQQAPFLDKHAVIPTKFDEGLRYISLIFQYSMAVLTFT